MITEREELFIGIHDDGQIELRKTRIIMEDGVVISKLHHRQVVEPDQNIDSMPDKLKNITTTVWTTRVKEDYIAAKITRLENEFSGTRSTRESKTK